MQCKFNRQSVLVLAAIIFALTLISQLLLPDDGDGGFSVPLLTELIEDFVVDQALPKEEAKQ